MRPHNYTNHLLGHSALSGPPADLERKDADPAPSPTAEMKTAFAEFLKTFDDYKSKNDQELAELKKTRNNGTGGSADFVTMDQVKKINDALDAAQDEIKQLRLEAARAPIAGNDGKKLTDDQIAHKKAFDALIRKGAAPDDFHELAAKALSVGVDPSGGYLAPIEVDRDITRLVSEASPMRQVAQVREIGAGILKKPVNLTGTSSGWVGETSTRPETNTPSLGELEFPVMELYANPGATQMMLDDAYVNVEQWLAEEVNIEFAEQEGSAFVTGDGVNKPKGFIGSAYTPVANASWAWGQLGYIATGSSGAFGSKPVDNLIDLVYAPKAAFRQGASFLMNRKTLATIRKVKDTTDQYLWQPSVQAGEPSTLLGYPTLDIEAMPDIAANSYSVAFGNFRRGYLIVDRVGVRVLRDPFTNKPFVMFYTTKRVGGGIQNFEAIKLLKFAAS